jgi:hypothetical protein
MSKRHSVGFPIFGFDERSLDVARNLLFASPDIAYLRQWAGALDVEDLLEALLNERHQP